MGSFDINCNLTDVRIGVGDRIVAICVSPNEYAKPGYGAVGTTDILQPTSFAFRGTYDDYGYIKLDEDFKKTPAYKIFKGMFKVDSRVDNKTPRDILNGDNLMWRKTLSNLLRDGDKNNIIWFAREEAYEKMLSVSDEFRTETAAQMRDYFEQAHNIAQEIIIPKLKGICKGRDIKDLPEHERQEAAHLAMELRNIFLEPNLVSHLRKINVGHWNYLSGAVGSGSHLHFDLAMSLGTHMHLAYKNDDLDTIYEFIDLIAESYAFNDAMYRLGKPLMNKGSCGMQWARECIKEQVEWTKFQAELAKGLYDECVKEGIIDETE